MKLTRPDLAAYVLVALCVVGIVVLTALHTPVPDFLTFAGTTALGIGGGVSLQGATNTAATAAAAPAPPAAPAAFAAPLPRPAATDPTTGIIPRIASHAP